MRTHKCILPYMSSVPHLSREVCANTLYIASAAIVEERYSFYFLCARISLTPTMILGPLGSRPFAPLPRSPRRSHHHSSSPTNCKLLGIYHHARVFHLETPFAIILLVIIIICSCYTTIILPLEDFGHQRTVLYIF